MPRNAWIHARLCEENGCSATLQCRITARLCHAVPRKTRALRHQYTFLSVVKVPYGFKTDFMWIHPPRRGSPRAPTALQQPADAAAEAWERSTAQPTDPRHRGWAGQEKYWICQTPLPSPNLSQRLGLSPQLPIDHHAPLL